MKLALDVKTNILPAFTTPIGSYKVPNAAQINPVLEKAILEREAQASGMNRSNAGGWHSENDLLQWPELSGIDLAESIQSSVMNMIAITAKTDKFTFQSTISSWANVNRKGSHNVVHNHAQSHWSGVYYVKSGEYNEDDIRLAGSLTFYDPRGSVNMMRHPGSCSDGIAIKIKPQDGDLIIFPSWLFHSVNPFTSDTLRISIAFNATIVNFEDKRPEGSPDPFSTLLNR
jgi:uncharacterized protein (TIGR02466 family)